MPYIQARTYEWDEAKDADNRRKHGIPLRAGIAALLDPDRLEWIDDRFLYGEERISTIGLAHERVLFVVHTMRGGDVCRLISVRKATRHEAARYFQPEP
jgi:uncharacterized DUF497 family protein